MIECLRESWEITESWENSLKSWARNMKIKSLKERWAKETDQTTSPSRAWLRLNAILVLACLPAFLPACSLARDRAPLLELPCLSSLTWRLSSLASELSPELSPELFPELSLELPWPLNEALAWGFEESHTHTHGHTSWHLGLLSEPKRDWLLNWAKVFLSPGPVCHLVPQFLLPDNVRYSSRQDVLSAGLPSLQPPGLRGLKQGSLQKTHSFSGNDNNTIMLILMWNRRDYSQHLHNKVLVCLDTREGVKGLVQWPCL